MLRLGWSRVNWGVGPDVLSEFAAEEVDGHAVAGEGEFGIVAVAFVAKEGVGAVEFVPRKICAGGGEGGVNFGAAFGGYVRVLAAPDHEQLGLYFRDAGKGAVVHAGAEGAFVDIGRVETGGGEHVGIHRGAEGEVAADADADDAEGARARGVGLEEIEDGAGVGVEGGDGLGDFKGVAAVGAGLVVGEDGAGGFVFVVNLGDGDDEAVAGEERGGAADRRGDLEDFGKQEQAGIAAGRRGAVDGGTHGTGGREEVDEFGIFDGHGKGEKG